MENSSNPLNNIPMMDAMPLHLFLEIMWGIKDKRYFNPNCPEDSIVLKSLLKHGEHNDYFHVQKLDTGLIAVWRRPDWDTDIAKFNADKARSEAAREEWERNKEIASYLEELIIARMGETFRGDMAKNFAAETIRTKNKAVVTMLGGDLERVKW